jgi:hypothetical protein
VFEICRRVDDVLSADVVRVIVEQSLGNMRSATLEALARRYVPDAAEHIGRGGILLLKLLSERPAAGPGKAEEWIAWAIRVEETCRVEGLDLRDVLKLGWTLNPKVSYYCSLLSRLGGTSPRIVFMSCLAGLVNAEK